VIEIAGARVFHGDCRDVLRSLPDNSVDSVVTDPPYELGFMGKSWDSSGIAYDVTVWQECLRVLKPGGHLVAFGGSRTYHRLGVAIEDAGFEIRDTIAWISSKTFPKSLNVSKAIDKKLGVDRKVVGSSRGVGVAAEDNLHGGINRGAVGVKQVAVDIPVTEAGSDEARQWEGWGTGLKQVVEPVVLARKPLIGTVAENTLAWGVGGLNIDASRISATDSFGGGAKATSGFVNGYENDGWVPGSEKGRWPANVILDEVTADLLDEKSGHLHGSGNKVDTGNGTDVGYEASAYEVSYRGRASRDYGKDGGGASRFFYVAKASKRDRNEGLEQLQDSKVGSFNGNAIQAPGNKIGASPDKDNLPGKNFHPTVKPTALMRYLIKLVTPEGGVVLDPFTGSGSTGKAALLDGFQFVGVELTEEYLPIIEGRLRWASEQVDTDDTLF
jgi:DNA modification methylase